MTPSQQAKAAGLSSLTEVSQMTGRPTTTLGNWHRDEPELFKIVIIGCSVLKHKDAFNKIIGG